MFDKPTTTANRLNLYTHYSVLSLEDGEKILSIITINEYKEDNYLFFATKQGVVKRTSVIEFESIRQNGKKAIVMRENDELIGVKLTDGNCLVSLSATNGKMVKFNEDDVRVMGRSATGVKGMQLEENDYVVSLTTSLEGKYILAISEKGYGKMSLLDEYRLTSRGAKGVITLNMTEKTGKLVSTRAVNGDEDVIVITKMGVVIRTSLSQVAISGRNTQGVKIIRIKDNESVSSLTTLPHEEEKEESTTDSENNNSEVSEN